MFTYHQITADSIKIANEGSKSLFYTDLTRQQEKQHKTQLKEDKNNVLYPKEEDDGVFSPACPTSINSRFVTMCLGPAGCGKVITSINSCWIITILTPIHSFSTSQLVT